MKVQDIIASLKYIATLVVRGYYYEQTDKLRLEYDAIYQNVSKITQIMIGWRTVAVSAAIALPHLAKYVELTTQKEFYWSFGIFGAVLLILWLILDVYFDKGIVRFYPKIRELERQLSIEKLYINAYEVDKWNWHWVALISRKRFINLIILAVYGGALYFFGCVVDKV